MSNNYLKDCTSKNRRIFGPGQMLSVAATGGVL